jgi:NAD(P)-dependent dehydrogenase (short-subunit alcohol dehydrogenase family)
MTSSVLITGASSGIGLAAVEEVARRGARVVATVRQADDAAMVEERQRRLGHPVSTDLLDLDDDETITAVIRRHRPDVVVNVAGDALLGPITSAAADDVDAALRQHVVGPMRLVTAALPHFRAQGHGRVVNVGSALSRTTVPMTGWYAACEAALATLTEVLRRELAPDGIEVVLVELGAVDTPAWDAAADPEGPTGDAWARIMRTMRPLFPSPEAPAKVIASAACDERPRPRYRVGFGGGLLALSGQLPVAVRRAVFRVAFPGPG